MANAYGVASRGLREYMSTDGKNREVDGDDDIDSGLAY